MHLHLLSSFAQPFSSRARNAFAQKSIRCQDQSRKAAASSGHKPSALKIVLRAAISSQQSSAPVFLLSPQPSQDRNHPALSSRASFTPSRSARIISATLSAAGILPRVRDMRRAVGVSARSSVPSMPEASKERRQGWNLCSEVQNAFAQAVARQAQKREAGGLGGAHRR